MGSFFDNPNGNTTNTYHDILGRVILVETPFDTYNGQLVYTKEKTYYDAGGRVIEEKKQNNKLGDAEAYTDTKYTYDNMNRLIKVEQVIDATHSQYTQYYYDSLGKLRRIYTGLSAPLTINDLDNITPGSDTDYSTTKYTYDFYGRLSKYTDGLGKTESYSYYDLTGQLYVKALRNGNTFTYTYDNSGNTTKIVGSMSGKTALTLDYTYDDTGNILTATDGTNAITYTYDIMSRPLTETDSYGATTYTKTYTYTGQGVASIDVTRNGVELYNEKYSYMSSSDKLYLINHFSSLDSNKSVIKLFYDQDGNITTKEASQALTQTNIGIQNNSYKYNLAGLPTSLRSKSLNFNGNSAPTLSYEYDETYSYRTDSNMLSSDSSYIDNSNNTSGKLDYSTYTYDNLGRLTSELYGGYNNGTTAKDKTKKAYTFDDYNNIASISYTDYANVNNNTTTTNTYNRNNQLTNQLIKNYDNSSTLHNYTFNYDDAGNMTSKLDGSTTLMTYAYDALNRTASINKSGVATTFAYDAFNQRISKTTGTNTTSSLWDDGKITCDIYNNGTTTSQTEYLPYNLGLERDGILYGNALDGKNNVLFTTTLSSLARTSKNILDSYGNYTSGTNPATPTAYRDQYTDSETGLQYLNARYYDPSTQQFTQEDTYWGDVKDPMSLNLYGYCTGNPVLYSDPTGHMNYLTQTGTLLKGIGAGVGDQAKGLLSIFTPSTYIELAKAIYSGKINLKSMVGSMFGSYIYVGKNINVLNPFKSASESQVYTMGKNLGSILVDIALQIAGGGTAFKALSKTKLGEKLLSKAEEIKKILKNSKAGEKALERAGEAESALSKASKAAFKAANNVEDFTVSNKHLMDAGGRWQKFFTNSKSQVNEWIQKGLRSNDAQFLPNNQESSYKIITDLGEKIGTKGETKIQIIIGSDGKIWTAYPIK